VRLIDEFLARSGVGRCHDLKDTAELISKVGFKLFLGITCTVANWSADEKCFSLLLDENPLAEFVELPTTPVVSGSAPPSKALLYSNVLCGVLRGALEMVQLSVECKFVKDVLRGDDTTEIRVEFKEYLADEVPVGDE
jgi:trafficking protein particle complex subunit 3